MDLKISYKPNPLLFSTPPLSLTKQRHKLYRKRPEFRALAAANPNGSGGFSWRSLSRSLRQGSVRFWSNLGDSVKKETGFDLEEANTRVTEFAGRVRDGVKVSGSELDRFRTDVLAEFVDWNKWQHWKVKFCLALAFSFKKPFCWGLCLVFEKVWENRRLRKIQSFGLLEVFGLKVHRFFFSH